MTLKYRKWTQHDIQFLKDNYLKKSYKEIATHLGIPNVKTVKSYANFIKIKLPLYEKIRRGLLTTNKEVYDVNNPFGHFIMGFIAGEGSFHKVLNGSRYRFTLSINMCIDDKDILQEISEYLKCGKVYTYKKRNIRWKDEAVYKVTSIKDIYTKIIPFIETFGLRNTSKKQQFKRWKEDFLDTFINPKISIPSVEPITQHGIRVPVF